MAIKDILKQIADKMGSDNPEVNSLLAAANREADNIIDDLRNANSESKTRKEKIRELQNELESKADFSETEKKLKAEIERLKTVETEYNTVKTAEQQKIVNTWKEKSKVFEVEKTAKNFDKISKLKTQFSFPDGEIDYDTAKSNLEKFSLLEVADAFGVQETKTPNGNPPNPNDPAPAQYKSSGAAIAAKLGIK